MFVSLIIFQTLFRSCLGRNYNGTLNILLLNENSNIYANYGWFLAINYIKMNFDLKLNIHELHGSNEWSQDFFRRLSSTYDRMLDENSPPHLIVDTTKYGLLSDGIKSFSASLAIPTVSACFGQKEDLFSWSNLFEHELNYLIQILPPADIIPAVVRSIVAKQNFSTTAILADETYEMRHKYKMLLQNLATRHIIAKLDTDNPIRQLLHVKKLKIFNVFVIGSIKHIKSVLNGAEAISMFVERYSWHAITHEMGDVSCECRNASIIYVRPSFISKKNKKLDYELLEEFQLAERSKIFTGFYFDFTISSLLAANEAYKQFFDEFSYIKSYDYNGSNTPTRNNFNLRQYFSGEKAVSNVRPFNLSRNGHSGLKFNMEILAVNLREGSVYTSKKLGLWAAAYDNPLELEDPQSLNIYNSRIVYRVITIVQRPLIYEDPEAPRKFSGFCVDVLDEIASMLNFDYEIFTVLDGQKGSMDKDGNWNGMVNELVYKRADIAIGSLSVTSQRSKFVDFTVPYYEMSGQTILMKLPTTHTSIFRYLIVFEHMVWLSIIGVYLITSFWLWLLYKLSPFGARYGRANEQMNLRNFTLTECLWFCLITFTPQGSGEAPSNASGRVMTACWWLFGFILVSSYSANLSAFLTVSRLETPIKSLEDLSRQYKIQYSAINNSNAMNYFKRMAQIERRLFLKWTDMNIFDEGLDDYEKARLAVWEYPLSDKYTKIWKQMNNVGLLNSTEEALEMIRASENFALMIDGIDAKYLDLTNCDLQIVGEEFNKKPLAFAVQLGSTLKDQMNSAVLQLYNKRILQRFKEKWWANNPNKVNCQVDSVSESINADNIFGIFIFLFIAALSVVIFALIKRFWSWLKTRRGRDN